jgi:hypothetical protein
MAYLYQVSFDIHPDQMDELTIGSALERVLSYMRALLPSEEGFLSARAFHSVDMADNTHLIVQSQWDRWEDLCAHEESELLENKVLLEFQPHIELEHLDSHAYGEVS